MNGIAFNYKLLKIFVIVMLVCSFLAFKSQELNPSNYGGHYTVNVGDYQTYTYNKYYNQNSPGSSGVMLKNGTIFNFNVTTGLTFKIIISTINSSTSSTGYEQFYAILNYSLPIGTISSALVNITGLIGPSFSTGSKAFAYYLEPAKKTNETVTLENNDIAIASEYNFTNGNNFLVSKFILKFSWKTGWLDDYETRYYSNSNLTSDVEFQSNLYNTSQSLAKGLNGINSNILVNYSEDIALLVTITVGVLVILVIGTSYRTYSKSVKPKNNSQSFYVYLKNIILFRNKNIKSNQPINVNKALEKIENIIQENNE